MGKLTEHPQAIRSDLPSDTPHEPVGPGDRIVIQGTPEQRLRNQAALEWLARRNAEYAAHGEEEKKALEREWELFKRLMNENHSGYRKPFLD